MPGRGDLGLSENGESEKLQPGLCRGVDRQGSAICEFKDDATRKDVEI